MKNFKSMLVILSFLTLSFQIAFAEKSREELAKETEQAAAASAVNKPTPQIIVEKVNQGCSLLEKEGKKAFPKFQGKDSEFIFAGTYLWVHEINKSTMRMHPIKYKLEGKRLIRLKDQTGKRFFAVMNEVAQSKGAGWVSYLWPKPGEKKPSQKISYVKKCMVDGIAHVVAAGVYDISSKDINEEVM